MNSLPVSPVETKLRELAAQRILVLDGAMGTMIQALKLNEEGYRGARFKDWTHAETGMEVLKAHSACGIGVRHAKMILGEHAGTRTVEASPDTRIKHNAKPLTSSATLR